MDISVIGAGGDVGREIVAQLVAARVLRPTERLQLVGKGLGASERTLYGLRSDLTDAYAESVPQIDIAVRPEDVVGDVIVMAAGVSSRTDSPVRDRDAFASANKAIFIQYAEALATYGHGSEVVLVVSNPVELGVAVFAGQLGARRVIGIGAYSDSLRFRREIAADLGVPRQLVTGYVAGEHGNHLIPLWSSVRVYGMDDAATSHAVARLRGPYPLLDFQKRVREYRDSIQHLLTTDTRQAFNAVELMPPDIRVQLRPELTHLSGSKTVMATANVTVDMVKHIVDGRELTVAGQIVLEGDGFYGIRGVLGVPLIASNQGVVRVLTPPIWQEEAYALHEAAAAIGRKIECWTVEA